MMYTIGNIIYGFPLTAEVYRALCVHEATENQESYEADEWDFSAGIPDDLITDLLSDATEFLLAGMETVYSGSADITPGWFGAKLGQTDECRPVRVKDVMLFGKNGEHYDKVKKLYDQLPPVVREAAQEWDLWIVWSTS